MRFSVDRGSAIIRSIGQGLWKSLFVSLGIVLLGSSVVLAAFLNQEDILKLSTLVERQRQRSLDAYANIAHLEEHIILGDGSVRLAKALTNAYFRRKKFVIGVTGGSASQGTNSWSYLLADELRTQFGMDVELRNAAQGSTSQVVTAPCINALVGENIDLLFWEFGMNDNGRAEHEIRFVEDSENPLEAHPHRCIAAESWIREAIMQDPGTIAFVHLWDINIHTWEDDQKTNVPNRSWKPTNYVMDYYSSVFNSFFSVDVIDMLVELNIDKRLFLRDEHHPNDFGYRKIHDLLLFALLSMWRNGLASADFDHAPLDQQQQLQQQQLELDLKQTNLLIAELERVAFFPLATEGKGLGANSHPYPRLGLRGHCLMSMVPQFSEVFPIYPVVHCASDTTITTTTTSEPTALQPTILSINVCEAIAADQLSMKTIGKRDPNRTDRKSMFTVEECDDDGGLYFEAAIPHPEYVLLDCGPMSDICGQYQVYINGKLVQRDNINNNNENLPLSEDHGMITAYYRWIHRLTPTDLLNTYTVTASSNEKEDGGGVGENRAFTPLQIRVCGPQIKQWSWKSSDTYNFDVELLARVVVLERVG